MIFTELNDPDKRRLQYIETLKFYLKKTTAKIVFVENSANDLSPYFWPEIQQGRLEIITCNNNLQAVKLGKGYGEMLIIEHAIKTSSFLQNATWVYKISGRYKVLNINNILRHYPSHQAKLRTVLCRERFVDSKIFGATPDFFSEFLEAYKSRIDDRQNFFLEHALFDAVTDARKQRNRHSYFLLKPRLSGITGSKEVKVCGGLFVWYLKNVKYKIRLFCCEHKKHVGDKIR